MAEAQVPRCFQNLSQPCFQWLRIPPRLTWHAFTYSQYLCALHPWLGFLYIQVDGVTGRQLPVPSRPLARTWGSGLAETPQLPSRSQRWLALFLAPLKAWGLDRRENPSCFSVVAKTAWAKSITRSFQITTSCTLSCWESCELLIHLRRVATGKKVKVPAPGWHYPWKQRLDSPAPRERTCPWKFLEQHMGTWQSVTSQRQLAVSLHTKWKLRDDRFRWGKWSWIGTH